MKLDRPAASLFGVGPRLSEGLARLGVDSIADLLCLLPQRYEDRTRVRPLGGLRPGEKVLIEAEIELAEVAFRRRRSLLCRLTDGTGAITLRFFHFSRSQQESVRRGLRLRCFGEVRAGRTGLEMIHPEYRTVGADALPPQPTLTPVYPTTHGLHQQRLRNLAEQALAMLADEPLVDYLADWLPESWPSINEAIEFLHRPPRGADTVKLLAGRHPCQQRIALEELLAHRLSLRNAAAGMRREYAFALKRADEHVASFLECLPFELTVGQRSAWREIGNDLGEPTPMHRLLQGDVGSGKTVVAALAALRAAASGCQAAVMAPTELLAEQHLVSFRSWFEPLGIEVVMLSGSTTGAARDAALRKMASGAAAVAVGTHALFQEAVRFRRLALIVVDEQHRFGVHQRLSLKRKGERGALAPHQLIMTATPIPRTLAMTAYADLDCSVISGLPPGRTPVRTAVMPEYRRGRLVERVAEHCRAGRQAYWVCPLIEESDLIDSRAALELERELAAALPGLSIALIHGRLKADDKERVMRAFKEARLHVLVATTVIEVGVDVPNATLMVIESSERLGLAQLHQLRGRVGRGRAASDCVLLYKPPLSDMARERLNVLRETNDGFVVADKDMQLRGPGEMLGTRQTGLLQFRVADLRRDADLLPIVIRLSDELMEGYPECVEPLTRRWIKAGREYAKV
ncbi:ATP-dependent DNA helicase RecG [Candidatus Rariloculus sp.]|uniref:ATP-dependent DNA helicase RecG n=1 Tax=Candidatus Rariloculus sp. TaxID=3101265 RepID=UPI003D13BAC2